MQRVWYAIKSYDPTGEHNDSNPEPGIVARKEYDSIPPNERAKFMDTLGILAKSMPQEKRAEFLRNLGIASSRAIPDVFGEADKFLEVAGASTTDSTDLRGLRTTNYDPAKAADTRARVDFSDEVRRVARDDFAPTAFVSKDGTWARTLEKVAYGVPGLAAFTAEAAIPVLGPAMVLSTMGGQAYSTVRDNLKAKGVTAERASEFAADVAPVVSAIQYPLMHFVSAQWLGKLPGLNGVLTTLGDQIENRAVRYAMRSGTGAVTTTLAMDLMNVVPSVAQDVGHALEQDIPDVKWTGEGGALNEAFSKEGTLETFLTMLPLSDENRAFRLVALP